VARVFLRDGSGAITVNGKPMEQYFAGLETATSVRGPLDVTNNTGKFDVLISVSGGGPSGQIEACRHGIARALTAHDVTNKPALRANGYLTATRAWSSARNTDRQVPVGGSSSPSAEPGGLDRDPGIERRADAGGHSLTVLSIEFKGAGGETATVRLSDGSSCIVPAEVVAGEALSTGAVLDDDRLQSLRSRSSSCSPVPGRSPSSRAPRTAGTDSRRSWKPAGSAPGR